MTTRRGFLRAMVGGAGLLALGAKTRGHAPFGLQLYSLRDQLEKDVPGTLAQVKAMGFSEVESAGFYGLSASDFRAALGKAGLSCRSGHYPFERLRDDASSLFRDVKTVGSTFVVCPWIPHDGKFTREDCLEAVRVFTKAARLARDQGLRFAYHLHGYEFEPSPEGTLFDTLAAETPADLVSFEVDVLWARAGGADPAALIEKLGSRAVLTHLKDLSPEIQFTPPTSSLPVTGNVVLGTGILDFPAILAASRKAGVEMHYLEDESPESADHLPRSLKYLRESARSASAPSRIS
jgi:sugar phosphate isomerase/epimerase